VTFMLAVRQNYDPVVVSGGQLMRELPHLALNSGRTRIVLGSLDGLFPGFYGLGDVFQLSRDERPAIS
jgi:hypothetical protein